MKASDQKAIEAFNTIKNYCKGRGDQVQDCKGCVFWKFHSKHHLDCIFVEAAVKAWCAGDGKAIPVSWPKLESESDEDERLEDASFLPF